MELSNIDKQIDELLKRPNVQGRQKSIDSLCSYNEWMRKYFENPGFLAKLNHEPQAESVPRPLRKCYADREITESDSLHSLGGKAVTEQQLEIERKSQKALRVISKIIKGLAMKKPEVLGQLDFSHKVLCGINLEGLGQEYNERRALLNFSNTYLQGANLRGANLGGSSLRRDARLLGVNPFCINLGNYGSNLEDANLAGADLAGAYLAGSYLAGAKLAEANLAEVILGDANLLEANLEGAKLPPDVMEYVLKQRKKHHNFYNDFN